MSNFSISPLLQRIAYSPVSRCYLVCNGKELRELIFPNAPERKILPYEPYGRLVSFASLPLVAMDTIPTRDGTAFLTEGFFSTKSFSSCELG